MEGNKDDAAKCFRIVKGALDASDRARAIKFVSKAKRLDPSLPVDHILSPLLDPQDDSSASASSSPSPRPPPEPAAAPAEGAEDDGLRERKQKGKKRQEEGQEETVAREYIAEQLEVVRQVKKHTRDYYQILGLDKDCTVEDLRKAYHKLSLKVHPDKNKAPGAEDAFKAVSKAFQCLSDTESRKRYDMVGSDEPVTYNRRQASNARAYNGFYEDDFDPDEIFRNFFVGWRLPQPGNLASLEHFISGLAGCMPIMGSKTLVVQLSECLCSCCLFYCFYCSTSCRHLSLSTPFPATIRTSTSSRPHTELRTMSNYLILRSSIHTKALSERHWSGMLRGIITQ
jgi:hypothetical protein